MQIEKVSDDKSSISFKAPTNANLYPPGYYMMFYVNNFVQVNVGPDPVISQTPPDAERNQKWPKKWGEPETIDGFNFPSWVHLKGGEYFFAPSISFLKNLTSIE